MLFPCSNYILSRSLNALVSHNKDFLTEDVKITTKDVNENKILKVGKTDLVQIEVNNIKYTSLV